MLLLKILQQNAEWMCAIAITFFAAVQCWLSYQQNLQNIKIKRLELANSLDMVCSKFLGEKREATEILIWLNQNASNFVFLLNKNDRVAYKKLLLFLMKYRSTPSEYSSSQKEKAILELNNLLSELDSALGNANYGFVNDKYELQRSDNNILQN
jgi:hypothetical protein